MRKIRRTVLTVGAVCGLSLAGCRMPQDAAAIRREVRADEAQWNADYKARDVAGVASHYAPNAMVMFPGGPIASGTQDIDKALARLFSNPDISFQFAADKVGISNGGDLAYARGPFRMTMTDPQTATPLVRTGSYITIYRRQSGGAWMAIETIAGDGPERPLPSH